MQRILSKAVMGHKEIWDQFIDSAVFTYNTSSHESTCNTSSHEPTNYTPFEGMLERKARIPTDADLESICELLSFFLPKLDFVLFFNLHCT